MTGLPTITPATASDARKAIAILAHAPGLNGRIARLYVNGRTPTQIAEAINAAPGRLVLTTSAVLTRLRQMELI